MCNHSLPSNCFEIVGKARNYKKKNCHKTPLGNVGSSVSMVTVIDTEHELWPKKAARRQIIYTVEILAPAIIVDFL